MGSKRHFIRTLESQGLLDRQIEFLPSDAELAERKARGLGLTRPGAVGAAVVLQDRGCSSSCSTPTCRKIRTCPRNWCATSRSRCRRSTPRRWKSHRLKREIIATAVTNSMVNRMGATFTAAHDRRQRPHAGRGRQGLHHHPRSAGCARAVGADRRARRQGRRVGADRRAAGDLEPAALVHALAADASGRDPGHRHRGRAATTTASADIRAGENILARSQRPGYEASLRDWKAKGVPAELGGQLAALPYLELGLRHHRGRARAQAQAGGCGQGALPPRRGAATCRGWWRRSRRWRSTAAGTRSPAACCATNWRRSSAPGRARCWRCRAPTPMPRSSAWLDRDDATLRFTLSMLNELAAQKTLDYPTASVAVQRLSQLASRG